MKKLQKVSLYMVSAFALAFVAVGFSGDTTFAADKKDAKSTSDYAYVAQTGDSYTQIARKAVQTYGITEKVKLSPAQIVAAETQLTAAAGTPLLEVGQEVKLKKNAVKAAVEAVQKLDAATLAAWAWYVPYIDFDTRAIGQSS